MIHAMHVPRLGGGGGGGRGEACSEHFHTETVQTQFARVCVLYAH